MARYLLIDEAKTTYCTRQVVVRVPHDMTQEDALAFPYLIQRLSEIAWECEDDDHFRCVEGTHDPGHECDIDIVGFDMVNRLLDQVAAEDGEEVSRG